jgi:drug/metabolite transporter (DMT)-like permease
VTPTAPKSPPTWLPLAAAAVTVLFWASAFVAIRHVGHEFSPGALTLGRLLVATVLLGGFVVTRPWRWPARRDWPPLVVCGVLWFGVYNTALNAAELRVDAGTAAMLVNIGPLLIALLAGLLLGEGFPRAVVLGSAVAFAGVLVIGVSSSSGSAELSGVLLCLLAAATYAIAVVTQKPLLARLPALQVTWLACTIGTVSCLPFAGDLVHDIADARPSTTAWLVYLGVFPTAIAFTTWAYALSRTSAGKMGATTYLVPPIAILLGWLLLDETPAALAVGGGALCLLGVYLSRRDRSPAAAPPPEGTPGRPAGEATASTTTSTSAEAAP